MPNHWILIGILSIATYLSRIIGLEFMAGRTMSPAMRLYFQFVPTAIMSALIVKQIWVPADGQLQLSFPVLIGCLAAAVAMKAMNQFLSAVVIGIFIGWLVRHFWIG